MRTTLASLLAFTIAILLTGSALAQPSQYEKILNRPCSEQQVLAAMAENTDTKDPDFVPISLLEAFLPSAGAGSNPPDETIPDWVVEGFLDTINARRVKPNGRCQLTAHDGSAQCDTPVARTIDVIAPRRVVVLATLEHLTEAWNTTRRTIHTIVYLRIDEVLRDTSGRLYSGLLVTYTQPWGSIEIGGVTICAYPPRGLLTLQPPLGDQVVVAGALDLRNENNLVTAPDKVFRVVDHQILPNPTAFDSCVEPTLFSLDSLRAMITQ